jgi:osmotically-inducible protein OsmY
LVGRSRRRKASASGSPTTRRVFVGNTCIDDNVAEIAKIAVWKAIGDASHGVAVVIAGNRARLEGAVSTLAERAAAEAAVLKLSCVQEVENRLKVDAKLARRLAHFAPEQDPDRVIGA